MRLIDLIFIILISIFFALSTIYISILFALSKKAYKEKINYFRELQYQLNKENKNEK